MGRSARKVILGAFALAHGWVLPVFAQGAGHDMLEHGVKPSRYAAVTPKCVALLVNRERARMLGITLTPEMGIEEYIDEAAALKEDRAAATKP